MEIMRTTEMKTPPLKNLFLGIVLAFGAIGYANDTPPKVHRFHRDNQTIKHDVTEVVYEREAVKGLEEKIKKDDNAGDTYLVNTDKENLARAEADLKRSKSYLIADKKDFERDYCKAIKDRKATVRRDKKDLRENKVSLRKAIRSEDDVTIKQSAARVAGCQNKLDKDREALATEQANRKADIAIINEEVKKSKEELKLVKSVETAYADSKSGIKGWFKRSKKS
jgi:hypothetical protein